jgi:hypothetical protein
MEVPVSVEDQAAYNLGVHTMEFLVLWIAFAMIATIIAGKKDEAGWGCLWGVLLGPIGVLIAILSDGDRKPCPFCQEKVHKAATVCPHCRKDLPTATN